MKPIVAVLIALGVAVGGYVAIANLPQSNTDLDQQLADLAEEGNAHLPMMVDAQTRLDSMLASSGNGFAYNYTLVNLEARQIDRAAFEKKLEPHLKTVLCTGSDNALFRDNGVNVTYTYHGNDGGEVASVVVPASACDSAA